jgi:hypothetical protein
VTGDRVRRWGAWTTWWLLLAAVGAQLLLAGSTVSGANGWAGEVVLVAVVLSFPATGALIVQQQPRNTVGWLLVAIGAAWLFGAATDVYSRYGLVFRPGSLPGATVAAVLNTFSWEPAIGLTGTFLLLLFPDGRLPSRRWRPVAWLSGITVAGTSLAGVFVPGRIDSGPAAGLANPLGVHAIRGLLITAIPALLLVLASCIAACSIGLVVRLRRATGLRRLQLAWLATAGALVAGLYLSDIAVSLLVQGVSDAPEPVWLRLWDNLGTLSLILLPLSIGIAVTRHRLYEIDRIVNRALVYGPVLAVLAAVYAGSVLLLQLVLQPVTDRSDLAVAASTLAVAVLFRPLRRRVRTSVDRRFFRRRYDAGQVVTTFSTRLRDQVDLDTVRAELLGAVSRTVLPESASVWVRRSAGR